MPGLTRNERIGLWAILWRVLIFGPFLGILGLALLVLVIALFIAPPVYALISFFTGDWLFGIVALIPWLVVLRFRRRILLWTFEGIDYGNI